VLTSGKVVNFWNRSSASDSDGYNNGLAHGYDFDTTILKVDVLVPAGRNCAAIDLRFLSNENNTDAHVTDGFVMELDATSWTVSQTAIPPVSAPNAVTSLTSVSPLTGASPVTFRTKATPLLTASTPITPGAHTFYFSVFDTQDDHINSDAELDALRFTSVANPASECATGVAPIITNDAAPTISGAAVVGGGLQASPGHFLSTSPMAYSYSWLRDGTPISGATSVSYQPIAADVGHALAVQVTASNGSSRPATSAATAPVGKGTLKSVKPKVAGAATVGTRLKAKTGHWGPGQVKLTYQWYRGSKKIKHATKKTYTLTAADAGSKVKVVVTGSASGYQSASVGSKRTAPVTR
jgi:hypothetical protein